MPVSHNTVAGHREPFDLICLYEANGKLDDRVVECLKVLLCPIDLNQMAAHKDLRTGSLSSWLILRAVGGWVISDTTAVSTRHGNVEGCLDGCGGSKGESMVMCKYW